MMDITAKYGFKLMKLHHHAGHHRKRVAMETEVVITIEGYFVPSSYVVGGDSVCAQLILC
jgi:hypothetical protein